MRGKGIQDAPCPPLCGFTDVGVVRLDRPVGHHRAQRGEVDRVVDAGAARGHRVVGDDYSPGRTAARIVSKAASYWYFSRYRHTTSNWPS